MVGDKLRNKPLLSAIKSAVKNGDTVLDIGTGLGMLAIAASKAGAKKVYAIECDKEALKAAQKNIIKAKCKDKITLIEGLSFDVKIKEKIDILICETVGSFAFDENILSTILDAKHRFLKKRAKIIPSELEIWGAPISILPKLKEPAEIAYIKQGDLIGEPSPITKIGFMKDFGKTIHVTHQFSANQDGTIKAFALWPNIIWWKNFITDASPLKPKTHWAQGIFPLEPKPVTKNEKLSIEIIFTPHPDSPKLATERLWRWASC